MTDLGTFSIHPSEEHDTIDFELFHLEGRTFILDRRPFGEGNWGEFFMLSRAKYLGRQFASKACAADALETIKLIPEDAERVPTSDQAQEWETLDLISKSLLTALCDRDAFTSASTFCGLMKISGSDAIFHAFEDHWRPAAAPTEEMLAQAATEAEEKFVERYGDYHAHDIAVIRSEEMVGHPSP